MPPLISTAKKREREKNPIIQLLSQWKVFRRAAAVAAPSLHTTMAPCYAWHCLSLIRLVVHRGSTLPRKRAARQTLTKSLCPAATAELNTPLLYYSLYVRSSAHGLCVMDDASARVPHAAAGSVSSASSASRDNSIHTHTHTLECKASRPVTSHLSPSPSLCL